MKREVFVSMALLYLGCPTTKYSSQLSGCNTVGFDCSGFINFLLKQAKYPEYIPRHASEIFDSFGISIHEQFRKKGDLIFFSYGGAVPSHVGIMISKNEYIHSSEMSESVVCIRKIEHKIIKSRNKTQQIFFSNPIGFKRITIDSGRYKKIFFE